MSISPIFAQVMSGLTTFLIFFRGTVTSQPGFRSIDTRYSTHPVIRNFTNLRAIQFVGIELLERSCL